MFLGRGFALCPTRRMVGLPLQDARKFFVMKSKKEKPECEKSPTGKHKWEKVEEDRVKWPRGDWGCIPGNYCKYCEIRQPRTLLSILINRG